MLSDPELDPPTSPFPSSRRLVRWLYYLRAPTAYFCFAATLCVRLDSVFYPPPLFSIPSDDYFLLGFLLLVLVVVVVVS